MKAKIYLAIATIGFWGCLIHPVMIVALAVGVLGYVGTEDAQATTPEDTL